MLYACLKYYIKKFNTQFVKSLIHVICIIYYEKLGNDSSCYSYELVVLISLTIFSLWTVLPSNSLCLGVLQTDSLARYSFFHICQIRLTIMIEDPRDTERKRLLGIEDPDGVTRDDLVAALEDVCASVL